MPRPRPISFSWSRRRWDEIGDRLIDNRTQARTTSICVAGGVAAVAVAGVAGFGPANALLGSVVLAAVIGGVVHLTVRDANDAQSQ
jgi:hypothetical protein